jgi:DNA-binding MarR family transcriptional regulator
MEKGLEDTLAQLPGYALKRAAAAMMAELASRLAGLDLRVSDASVLILADAHDNATSSQIGNVLDIQRANMVPLLNRLEAAGLITREPIDRKSMAIILTPLGRERLSEVKKITAEFEADLIARVPEEHREHLLPALNALWR